MIIVSGTIPVQPDKRDEAIAAAQEMVAATVQENGCHHYQFYSSIDDPNLFRVYEEWESMEALQAHFETPHMATFRQKLPNLVAGPGKIKRFEADEGTLL